MGKIWMMFEGYWRDLPQNEIDGLPKKSVSANAFEAGWKAAEQSVHPIAFVIFMRGAIVGLMLAFLAAVFAFAGGG